MHRMILLSNTYQQSSAFQEEAAKVDPNNKLLWRFDRRRLEGEVIRDSMLLAAGKLNLSMGGRGVFPPLPPGVSRPGSKYLGWKTEADAVESNRRSVYVHIKRSLQVPILSVHDQADTDSSCPVRYTTTVPTQALGMLNGEFSNEQAAALAERLRRETPGDLDAQVRRAIRLTTGRTPKDDEVRQDVAFVRSFQRDGLKRYCLLALNANEFIYLD